MRQRAVIAMAIANDPDLIIADEPTTALDVTVQAQVLQLLETAQEVTGAGIVIITHDLGVVAGFADRLMVMYAGRAVETGLVDEIYQQPRMPYTLGLLGSIPRLDVGEKQALVPIDGQPPSLTDLPPGCPFAPRCPMVVDACHTDEPPLRRRRRFGRAPRRVHPHRRDRRDRRRGRRSRRRRSSAPRSSSEPEVAKIPREQRADRAGPRQPGQGVPGQQGRGVQAPRRHRARGRRASRSTSARARPSASSASRAAARPRR